ncbi:RidA family protein [Micromonospora sp. NPDC126480]|uniref:RidA family protein n=1 Tax=Micromonospora sp. NPDC126480 TaxID=3155312 RepID=UPI0033171D51
MTGPAVGDGLTAAAVHAAAAARQIALPRPPVPLGAYAAAVRRGDVVALSGQLPLADGTLTHTGRVGVELTVAEGVAAARQAALNVVAQIAAVLADGGTLVGLSRVDGYVAGGDDFTEQPTVLDGASALFVDLLGDEFGQHARTAVGVCRLPMDAAVELGVTFLLGKDR